MDQSSILFIFLFIILLKESEPIIVQSFQNTFRYFEKKDIMNIGKLESMKLIRTSLTDISLLF
uniref:Uncharacterized protein n=1 Tax=Setaria viridis TaxID=4556 RepID=A0A4U6UF57_SETVI|nr:hypothetical protein SEVIR_5G132580v2 [Setaria viridis]